MEKVKYPVWNQETDEVTWLSDPEDAIRMQKLLAFKERTEEIIVIKQWADMSLLDRIYYALRGRIPRAVYKPNVHYFEWWRK